MLLGEVLVGCAVAQTSGDLRTEILGVEYDSRRVSPGALFVAIRGAQTDGARFAADALANGAVAVVSASPRPEGVSAPWIQVQDDRAALAAIAANFYGRPTERLRVVGVTGTNGKTTTTYLIESILKAAGLPAAVFGTIEYRGPGFERRAERTTPEAPDLEKLFRGVVDAGWNYAVMEVSSHAIALKRVEGLHFDTAVFTNLTRDHLDFHADMRSYFLAKKRLFTGLDGVPPRIMVLNADDPRFEELRAVAPASVISYGIQTAADVHPSGYHFGGSPGWKGSEATLKSPVGELHVRSELLGKPNLYNISAAVGAAVGLGLSAEAIVRGIAAAPQAPGRFEAVDAGQPFRVIVDYAHTDDALANLLQSAREITTGKVILVFGCGGERDRTKRPLMGEVAARSSDLAVVTSDNPRGEDPLAIIREIETGLRRAGAQPGGGYHIIPDRRSAIRYALTRAQAGDAVLIAGKGHETHQVIGNKTLSFDDRAVARELLDELAAGRN